MKISDEKLYDLCCEYGMKTKLWRQKFAGLLPEVQKRKLYEKKGFHSIFEFAKKLAGMNEEQVSLVLNLEKKFEKRGATVFKNMLIQGEVSANKIARVASVVTIENENFWAEQVKLLSKSALDTLVRDEKKSLPGHESGSQLEIMQYAGRSLQLELDVEKKLFELQDKGININVLLRGFLEKREQEIATEKARLAFIAENQAKPSRYIPAETKRLLYEEYGNKCALPNCRNEAETIHHTTRFALSQNHNPYYLAPLCASHHQIAHSIDLKFRAAKTSALFQQAQHFKDDS